MRDASSEIQDLRARSERRGAKCKIRGRDGRYKIRGRDARSECKMPNAKTRYEGEMRDVRCEIILIRLRKNATGECNSSRLYNINIIFSCCALSPPGRAKLFENSLYFTKE